jgi:hypothetical protein
MKNSKLRAKSKQNYQFSYKYAEGVFAVLVVQQATRMHRIILPSEAFLTLSQFSRFFQKRHDKKN